MPVPWKNYPHKQRDLYSIYYLLYILTYTYTYIYICIRLHIHTSCHHYIVHLLSSKPTHAQAIEPTWPKPWQNLPTRVIGRYWQQWKILPINGTWQIKEKMENISIKNKCQNMEAVNYFTKLPFPIFTKNIFP